MASGLLASIGMSTLPTVSGIWDSTHARLNLTFGQMRQNGNIYKYIGVYVDDIAAAAKDPKAITDILQAKYQFKLKGTGPISFHIGHDFVRVEDGTMCMSPRKYIEKLLGTYECIFVPSPSRMSPLLWKREIIQN